MDAARHAVEFGLDGAQAQAHQHAARNYLPTGRR
jgi:hypothetical protein